MDQLRDERTENILEKLLAYDTEDDRDPNIDRTIDEVAVN